MSVGPVDMIARIAASLALLLTVQCSPSPSSVAGTWRVAIPYGWQDVYLRDHVVELRLGESGQCSISERWKGGSDQQDCRWRLVESDGRSIELVIDSRPRERVQRYRVRRGITGWWLELSNAPDQPLQFERV
jgi:hypothetical protein